MRTVCLHVLCEGQTELRFASKVLSAYLVMKDIIVLPQLLITSRKKNARGGILSYQQAKRDLAFMIRGEQDNEQTVHYFTTMFDLYALPDDFPGFTEASVLRDYSQVAKLEDAFCKDVNYYKFIPYIQLHEFEALVLCDIEGLKDSYPNAAKKLTELKDEVNTQYHDNMELVDNSADTAPSKRIIKALKGEYHYDKPKSGTEITNKIGIDTLRTKCQHFNDWLTKIESTCKEVNSLPGEGVAGVIA